jgi:hypothetical protein
MEMVGIFYVWPFGNLAAIWHIFPRLGILCQENLATLVMYEPGVATVLSRLFIMDNYFFRSF